MIYVTGTVKKPYEDEKSLIFSFLLYHNVITIHTNMTKCLPLMQNLMEFLLQFTEMEYHI